MILRRDSTAQRVGALLAVYKKLKEKSLFWNFGIISDNGVFSKNIFNTPLQKAFTIKCSEDGDIVINAPYHGRIEPNSYALQESGSIFNFADGNEISTEQFYFFNKFKNLTLTTNAAQWNVLDAMKNECKNKYKIHYKNDDERTRIIVVEMDGHEYEFEITPTRCIAKFPLTRETYMNLFVQTLHGVIYITDVRPGTVAFEPRKVSQ